MTVKPQKFIQVTDCHLFASPDGKLLGMETQSSLDAVLQRVQSEHPDFDFFLGTGDLSQDGSVDSYIRLKDQLDAFGKEQFWLPGNHDHRDNMLKVVSEQKEMVSVVKKGAWQIVLMDSQVPGSVHGRFSDSELQKLETALQAEPDLHTLVTFHHHPIPMDCKWLDNQQIKNSDAFLELVSRYDNVRVLLWGHIHQDSNVMKDGVRYISTPSTCVQFTPKSTDFSVDSVGPGYRWMELYDDGSIQTGVSRVDDIEFEIDYTIKGY